jgi:hypothetical protein
VSFRAIIIESVNVYPKILIEEVVLGGEYDGLEDELDAANGAFTAAYIKAFK